MDKEERLYEVLLRICNDPSLAPFIEYLKERREKARDDLEVTSREKDAGRSLELKLILQDIEGASKILEKLRGRPRV